MQFGGGAPPMHGVTNHTQVWKSNLSGIIRSKLPIGLAALAVGATKVATETSAAPNAPMRVFFIGAPFQYAPNRATSSGNHLERHLNHQLLVDAARAAGGGRDVIAEIGVRTRRLLAGERGDA